MRTIRRLGNDQDGAVLVFVALAMAVFLGLVAMSFDLGRVAATQSDLQSFADSMALAVAGELDGKPDAITRAEAARVAMITDTQSFGQGGRMLDTSDVTLTYLAALGNETATPPGADIVVSEPYTAAQQRRARYVRVDVNLHSVQMSFASAMNAMFGAAAASPQVSATAVAGFTQFACDTTPIMFCIPNTGWSANANVGQTLVLRTGGPSAAWQPGNFGFLDPTTTAIPNPTGPCAGLKATGNELWRCLVGATGQVTACYDTSGGVDSEPGQRNGLANAFNTRFDRFEATMSGEATNPAYAPAPNVIDGVSTALKGNKCDTPDDVSPSNTKVPASEQSRPLPPDDCITNNNCTAGMVDGVARFGNGVWTEGRRQYIDTNYGNNNGVYTDDVDPFPAAQTRYQVYLAEIAAAAGGRILGSPRRETGLAQCHPAPTTDPDRRTIIAAAVDCQTNTFSGRASDIPVQEFVKIFMVAPVGTSGSEFQLYGEVVGSVGGAGSTPDGQFRDFVQLYR